jgi:hypothetical protein
MLTKVMFGTAARVTCRNGGRWFRVNVRRERATAGSQLHVWREGTEGLTFREWGPDPCWTVCECRRRGEVSFVRFRVSRAWKPLNSRVLIYLIAGPSWTFEFSEFEKGDPLHERHVGQGRH